jgi:hypothetical protein
MRPQLRDLAQAIAPHSPCAEVEIANLIKTSYLLSTARKSWQGFERGRILNSLAKPFTDCRTAL